MDGELIHNRRSTDTREHRMKETGEKVVTWAAIIASISTCAIFYTRVVDLVDAAPVVEKRLTEIEKLAAVQDDRWKRVEKFMERMDRRWGARD